jgi:type IX secretion system PorP/SprF family membrane protein
MGLAFHGFQYTLDYSKLEAYDIGDPTLQTGSQSTFVPDADFGIYLYNKKYTFGISANQLLNIPINITNIETNNNSMVRHYYIIGSYIVNLSKNIDFEPSVLIKGTESAPFQVDFNFKFIFNKNYWLSVTYRTKNTAIGMIGFNYNRFVFGYAYDYYFSEIQGFQSGSHEIVLGYNFGQNLVSKTLLNSIRTF